MHEVANGLLPASGTVELSTGREYFPCTLTLSSPDVSRKIEISPDGIEWLVPDYDMTTSSAIAVAIMASVVKVRFTGVAGDEWRIV
jgi:hypothetical protein